MLSLHKKITLTILTIIFLSCGGQITDCGHIIQAEKQVEVKKITLPENGFSRGFLANDSTLWFSSNGGGIYHFDGKKFRNYTTADGLPSNQVYSIAEDSENLWFGTQNGLAKYNSEGFTHIPIPYQDTSSLWLEKVYPIINPNAVFSLEVDEQNNLWVGTTGGGAYMYDGKTFESHLREIGRKQEDSLYHNWVSYINKDIEGNMWFASMTGGGVSKFDGQDFTHYFAKDGLSDNWVRMIYMDKSDRIWFGFNGNRGSGLTVFDGATFNTYTIDDGLCHQQIRGIYEDKQGHIWLGSDRGGMCIFDGHQFKEFNHKGQTFDSVHFIFEDFEENVWFGGRYGIWKYDGQTLTEITNNTR